MIAEFILLILLYLHACMYVCMYVCMCVLVLCVLVLCVLVLCVLCVVGGGVRVSNVLVLVLVGRVKLTYSEK